MRPSRRIPQNPFDGRTAIRFAILFGLLTSSTLGTAAPPTGEEIYKAKCASCHGAQGEGVADKYPHPLEGERSIAQLSRLIARTMPEDNVGGCVGPDADKVAEYIHDRFYSPTARERNKPARIDFSRLTARQYQNAVADLFGSFRGPGKVDEKRGLKAEVFDARNFRNDKRVFEKVDPNIDFDFQTGAPKDGDGKDAKVDPKQFSIRWRGSLLAPETGIYEIILRTDHAGRVNLNDDSDPLIDATVKSGKEIDYKATIFLIAGRSYPVSVEFMKAKQGVDDTKKEKERPSVPAQVRLLWKTPSGPLEAVPQHRLSPNPAPEMFVVSTPFPPDDRSLGWERGTAVTREWDQATTEAALEMAGKIARKADRLAGTNDKDPKRLEKLKSWARQLADRAFRKPLSDEEAKRLGDRCFVKDEDPVLSIKKVVLVVLKSPRFLYREGLANQDSYATASRLSFGIWDSIPDQELYKAAQANKLATSDQIRAQAERMIQDPRAKNKLRDFILVWLRADQRAELSKDTKLFAGFDDALVSDLKSSLELRLNQLLDRKGSPFSQLFEGAEIPMSERMAKFYRATLPAGVGFRDAKIPGGERVGVLTHPYLLASLAYTKETSPIHRGVFLARGVLGVKLRPPPEAVAPLAPDLHPNLTTRERVNLQTSPPACITCHSVINPLGFTLESFDAVGRFRDKDHGKPVDAKGAYLDRKGITHTFYGISDLAKWAVRSEEVHSTFAEQMFHNMAQQPVRAYGPNTLESLRVAFERSGLDIRKLAVEVLMVQALPQPARAAMAK